MHSNIATYRSYNQKMSTRHKINSKNKSNNTANRLWNIFQPKNEIGQTFEKEGHHKEKIFSDSQTSKNSVQRRLHFRSNKSRARPKDDQLNRGVLPTDDPTQHVQGISFEGPQFPLCRY